jgi:hypothetical protein
VRLPTHTLVLLLALILGTAVSAEAAFTTNKCVAAKAKAWGKRRACERVEDAKRVLGKAADLEKCRTAFAGKLAKLDAKATKAAVACRFLTNGDGTVTDYDTGLEWEQKTGEPAFLDFPGMCAVGDVHCVNDAYSITDFRQFPSRLNTRVTTGQPTPPTFAGRDDWRLPTLAELSTILDPTRCGTGVPCIDPIFGPTRAEDYWTSTISFNLNPLLVTIDFETTNVVQRSGPALAFWVRAVRSAF